MADGERPLASCQFSVAICHLSSAICQFSVVICQFSVVICHLPFRLLTFTRVGLARTVAGA
jgi:hypothetical protein